MFSRADAYERYMGRWSRPLAVALVELAEVRDGDAVLDVGTGTGALAAAALARADRVIGIDPSPEYVAAAARLGDERLRVEVGDARQLPFADASFERALSLLVLNFVPEPVTAVREMRRVTRPGGVVAAAVWDYADGMEMLRAFWDEAVALDPEAAARDEGKMPLCRRGELGELWRAAGLVEVDEAALVVPLRFASFDDFWAPFLLGQGPAGAYVAGLAAGPRAALADRLRARLLGEGPERGFELAGRAWAVRGRVAAPS